MKSRSTFIRRFIWVTAFACLQFIIFSSAALAEGNKHVVRVMTRNMDAGTDLQFVAAATDETEFVNGVLATIAEVDASNIPARAERLAAEIAETKPDLIALQEVTFWDIKDASGHRIYDQLQLLRKELSRSGQHYKVAAIQTLTDLPVVIPGLCSVRFTDFNAILVRNDLPRSYLRVLGSETHDYENYLVYPLPGMQIPAPNGWMAVEVEIGNVRFKFANTHLLSASPLDFNGTASVQLAQAEELVAGLNTSNLPIILAGDFNSAAEPSPYYPFDATDSYGYIASSFFDAWNVKYPSEPGYTWPLFWEDFMSGEEVSPLERIDLIFSRGLIPRTVMQTGTKPVDGVYASDHVGVVADFDLENHPPDKTKGKK